MRATHFIHVGHSSGVVTSVLFVSLAIEIESFSDKNKWLLFQDNECEARIHLETNAQKLGGLDRK